MNQLKIAAAIAAAAVLQTYLRMLWPPLGYIDFALIIVVYFALQRDAVRAVSDEHGWELVENATNAGFGTAANTGVARAAALGCTSVVVVNPDALVDAHVLDELAEEARSSRLGRAEEMAAKIPVKMVIPMAFFMLPALLVMIFGPVAAELMNK